MELDGDGPMSPIKALGNLNDGDATPSQQALEFGLRWATAVPPGFIGQGQSGTGYWMVGLQVDSPAATRLAANLQADSVKPSTEWQAKRIEAGIPYFGIDFDEQHLRRNSIATPGPSH